MRRNIYLTILICCTLLCSCNHKVPRQASPPDTPRVADTTHIDAEALVQSDTVAPDPEPEPIVDLKTFKKYQTFNEFKMRPEGQPVDTPFVYVKIKKNLIQVVVSNDTSRVIEYHRVKNRWYSYAEFDLHRMGEPRAKTTEENLPRTYHRICGNDTILELFQDLSLGYEKRWSEFYLKTRNKCCIIKPDDDDPFLNEERVYETMLKYARAYNAYRKGKKHAFKKLSILPAYPRIIKLRETPDEFIYDNIPANDNSFLLYKKSALGFFGIQPGIYDKYNRNLSEGLNFKYHPWDP